MASTTSRKPGILPGLDNLAWDIQGYEVTSWYGALVKGIFNLGPQMTKLEVFAYLAYLVPTMYLFLRPVTPQTSATALRSTGPSRCRCR